MISFLNDYSAGAHERIMARLMATNLVKTSGYGTDDFCAGAKEKIRAACACPEAEIFFLAGGTQTNQIAIDTLLAPYEGAISAVTGHINTHESGAIEFTGHKVLALPEHEGKLCAAEIADYCRAYYADPTYDHMVFPGLVYVSQPTELGTLYTKAELEAIRAVCDEFDMHLYLDGARLGYALACEGNDLSLEDIAAIADAFYIGGTKVGALYGEALVFTKGNMPRNFLSQVKQHGALAAKGRLLGLQFDELFTDGLYREIGAHALRQAAAVKNGLAAKGYGFFADSPTNQLFPIVSEEKYAQIRDKVACSYWCPLNEGRCVLRFVTDFATSDEDVKALLALM